MTLSDFAVNVRSIVAQLLVAAKSGKRLSRSLVRFAGPDGKTGYGSAWIVGVVDGEPPTVALLFNTESQTKLIYDQLAAKYVSPKASPDKK